MDAITICSDFGAPPKKKSGTVSTVFPSISHEVLGLDAMILVFWMLSYMQVRKQQLELDMEQQTVSKLELEYGLHIITLPIFIPWETLGWKEHKLESRLPGEISITSDMQMVIASMKLKDAYSLKEKLWPT